MIPIHVRRPSQQQSLWKRIVFVHPSIDGRDLLHPPTTVRMLQIHHSLGRPVKVIGEEGYLLIERLQGVAGNPPAAFISTVKALSHLGHTAGMLALPSWLRRLYNSCR